MIVTSECVISRIEPPTAGVEEPSTPPAIGAAGATMRIDSNAHPSFQALNRGPTHARAEERSEAVRHANRSHRAQGSMKTVRRELKEIARVGRDALRELARRVDLDDEQRDAVGTLARDFRQELRTIYFEARASRQIDGAAVLERVNGAIDGLLDGLRDVLGLSAAEDAPDVVALPDASGSTPLVEAEASAPSATLQIEQRETLVAGFLEQHTMLTTPTGDTLQATRSEIFLYYSRTTTATSSSLGSLVDASA
jgi:hypothetical protein